MADHLSIGVRKTIVRWEDQELNHASPDGKYPEVLAAKFGLLAEAERSSAQYVRVDQHMLDALPLRALREKKEAPRLDRVCLHFRLSCGLGPGGERHPVLGVMHYSSDSKSRYAIVHISPSNDWLRVMSVLAEEPIATDNSGLRPSCLSSIARHN